ncbi:lamin tail domain-containing protein [Haloarcula japonica]|uniref:lamin tail domain-containing protein n=1 Tax=Haloarcula japonica TaxID=29282 RepID=UPI0039F6BBE6
MVSEGIRGFIGGSLFVITGLTIIPVTRPLVVKGTFRLGGLDIRDYGTGGLVLIIIVGMVFGSIIIPPPEDTASAPETLDTSEPATTPTPTPTLEVTATPEPTFTPTPKLTNTPTPTPEPTAGPMDSPQDGWTVTFVSVTDGDTMNVRFANGTVETIRLLGVDTPETSVTESSPDEWEDIPDTIDGRDWLANWGDEATAYAEERLAGEEIYIETDPESDRHGYYGRLLVYAYQGQSSETSFNLRLLQNGYARYYSSSFSMSAEYQSAESDARSSNTRVWDYSASDTPTPTESGSSGSADDIEIADVHADADGNDHENLNDEYIVLENTGGSAVDMGGWTLADSADHTYYFPSGFSLGPGESVTIYTGSGSDSDDELYWGSSSAIWNNGGDTVIVETDYGETVISYEY